MNDPNYVIGPGGKGSNQVVAAAKAGIKTYFISFLQSKYNLHPHLSTKFDSFSYYHLIL